jgi:hypothetical protein
MFARWPCGLASIVSVVMFPGAARASCTYNSVAAPSGVFALSGDVCTAAAGLYVPTTQPDVPLPVSYTGFGFFATNLNSDGGTGPGGVINSPNNVTINTAGANNAYGAWSDGTGAQINFTGTTTITTTGSSSFGLYATGGGAITASGGSVTTSGGGASGLYATGVGSSVTATGMTISTSGFGANGVQADTGGAVSLTGGSVMISSAGAPGLYAAGVYAAGVGSSATANGTTIATSGTNVFGVWANAGGAVTLNGGSVTTSGADSQAIFIDGAGSTLQATGVAVTTNGASTAQSFIAGLWVYNGGTATFSGGLVTANGASDYGVAVSPNSSLNLPGGTTILAAGPGAGGVVVAGPNASLTATGLAIATQGGIDPSDGYTSLGVSVYAGGRANLTGGSVTATGDSSTAIVVQSGGFVQLSGTQITTNANGAGGIFVDGTGSTLTASGVNVTTKGAIDPATGFYANGVLTQYGGTSTLTGGSVSTTGSEANAVVEQGGGAVSLSGTTITTMGDAAKGFLVQGTGSVLSASNLSVTTYGTIDPATGYHAFAVYNGSGSGSGAGFVGGGTITLTNVTARTNGADSAGVVTANSGLTIVNGGSITTTGSASDALDADSGATVKLTGTNLTAQNNGSNGIVVNGGTLTASGSTVTANGNSSPATNTYVFGVDTLAAGKTTLNGGSVSTTGLEAAGVASHGAGTTVAVSGTTISTIGNASQGLQVLGTGSSLTASNLSVSTKGTINSADGDHAYGVYNGSSANTSYPGGGTASLTNVIVNTSGVTSAGVVTNSGGVTNVGGSLVATLGQDAHALYTTGGGSTANLSGTNSFATSGAGAIGVYAALGAVIAADGASMTNVTTVGAVSPANGLGAYGVNADGAGSKITLGAATIATSGAGAYALLASDAAVSGSAGSITATGTLNIKTTNPAATAVGLQGNNATILATGGGAIVSAGNGIFFSGGTNQTATFDNFTVNTPSGDLVVADPSTSAANFNNTTANAGANPLLNATGAGTIATFNANASTLTGTFLTSPGAVSNVNLVNGTTWNVTGPSSVTNLSVTNSVVVFAPPGSGSAFKTLTVTNYVGSGANIVMNASLGGAGSTADQIVVNGGKASGTSLITIKNIGGGGGLTSGSGIPLVTTTNGGTIAPNAFALANSPVVGNYKYSLDETNGDWYLVSSPTTTQAQVQNSVNSVAKAQQSQVITNRVLSSILIGATQQISCSSCGSGFGSLGSLAFGLQGRWGLSPNLTFIGGASYNQWSGQGIAVSDAPTAAGSLVYDFNWGSSRPFLQFGGGITPYENVSTTRAYPYGAGEAVGYSTAIDRNLSVFGRAGWLDRVTPIDEAAVYGDIGRNWMQTGAFSDATTQFNPYPESAPTGLDTLNIVRLGGQWTHLFNGVIEVNGSGAVAHSFGAGPGTFVNIYDFGPIAPGAVPNSTWFEYGARIGYRVNNNFAVDAFLLGTAGGQVGDTLHGGLALRFSF